MTIDDPVATANAALAADRAHADPAIWISRLSDEDVLARAARSRPRGPSGRPLWGVTVRGQRQYRCRRPADHGRLPGLCLPRMPSSLPAVEQRLLDAGAVLVGKTNLDQFATGLVGVRSPYGMPRNVFDAARVPGGSSSGSGVAVAAGIVRFALGTDTAGSGRVPAAFGNIVGLKRRSAAISARGMVPACRSIDTISVFARNASTRRSPCSA